MKLVDNIGGLTSSIFLATNHSDCSWKKLKLFALHMTHICPCEGGVGGEVWYLGVVVEQVDEDGPAEQRGAQAVQQPAAQGEHHLLATVALRSYHI